MKKLTLILLFSLFTSYCYPAAPTTDGQEIISEFSNNTISSFNDEFRKDRTQIRYFKSSTFLTDISKNSIIVDNGDFQLSGDSLVPGNSMYYGTNSTGTKGWYGQSITTQANDIDTGTGFTSANAGSTFLSVIKNITLGNTVFLTATGWFEDSGGLSGTTYVNLTQGSSLVQGVQIFNFVNQKASWSCSGIATGLSGNITFAVTAGITAGTGTAYGNLNVLEF